MALRIESNTVNEKRTPSANKQPQPEQKPVVVIPAKEESKADTEKPIEGYYVESTTKQVPSKQDGDEDDDKMDTSVDPDARVKIPPSIAIYNETSNIVDTMRETVNSAVSEQFHSSGEDAFLKAADMIDDKQAYSCLDHIKMDKKWGLYGKAVYERFKSEYSIYDSKSKVNTVENSAKIDFGVNFQSKSQKTKAMLFSSFTKTNLKADITNLEQVSPDGTAQGDNSDSANNHQLCLYGVLRQQFKKDFGTIGAFHINDSKLNTKTTNIETSYFFNKYMALFRGDINVYKLAQNQVTKLGFDVSLNPELAFPQLKEEAEAPQTEPVKKKEVFDINKKKWSRAFSPTFEMVSINGSPEEGLVGQFRLTRRGSDSTLRLGTFGKFSTTQKEDNNQYHVTFGLGSKYLKELNSNSSLQVQADLKDRITFGHGNILTANANVSYISPQVVAELEGKYINTTHLNSPDYMGVAGKIFYIPSKIFGMPNKNLNFFVNGSYTSLKHPEYKINGLTFQGGVVANF